MARIILDPEESLTFTSNVAGIVNGYAESAERVAVSDNSTLVFDATFNGGGDIISLAGDKADFQIRLDGSQAVITSVTDGITIRLPIGQATELRFEDDEALTLQVNGEGQPVLGDQVLTADPIDIGPISEPEPGPPAAVAAAFETQDAASAQPLAKTLGEGAEPAAQDAQADGLSPELAAAFGASAVAALGSSDGNHFFDNSELALVLIGETPASFSFA